MTQQPEPLVTSSTANKPELVPCLSRQLLSQHTHHITPWLHKVEENTDQVWTAEGIAHRFLEYQWQCWIVLDGDECLGCIGTELWYDDLGGLIFSIKFVIGKDVSRWVSYIEDLEQWAKDQGAWRCRHEGSPGYKKLALKDYKVTHYVFEKVLANGR